MDVLRARKRSSERIAIALMRRTATAHDVNNHPAVCGIELTVEKATKAESEHHEIAISE